MLRSNGLRKKWRSISGGGSATTPNKMPAVTDIKSMTSQAFFGCGDRI
jgi:hypothetical protein